MIRWCTSCARSARSSTSSSTCSGQPPPRFGWSARHVSHRRRRFVVVRRKHELIDALQELRMQEEDVGFLEAECDTPTTPWASVWQLPSPLSCGAVTLPSLSLLLAAGMLRRLRMRS